MKDQNKTRTQLNAELEKMRQHISELKEIKSERASAEKAMEVFQSAVEASTDAIGMSSPDGKHYYQNEAFDRMFGEIGENPPVSVYVDQAVGDDVFQTIMAGKQWTGEVQMHGADNKILDIFLRAYAVRDEDGRVVNLVGVHTDITKRVQMEKALLESEKKFRDLFEKTEDAILIIENRKFVDCNRATVKMLRYKDKNDLLNTHPSELSPEKQPDGKASLEKANEMMNIATENGSHRFLWDHKRADGEVFPVEVLLTAIDVGDEHQILHTTWRDVTKRVQQENALRENEKLLRTIADNYPNSYLSIIEKYFTIGYTTGQEFRKQNLDPEQFIGLTLEQIFDDKATIVREHYKKTFEGEERSFELFINEQYQYYRTVPLYAEDGSIPRILSVVENITERKRVELELRESEERFRTIFDTEPECVKILNPDATLVNMNAAGLAMIEAESLDMVKGQSVLPIVDDEFKEDFKKLTDDVCKKRQSGILEFRITGLKGTSRWLESHAVPLHNSEGDGVGLLSVTRDITERKQAKEEAQQQALEVSVLFSVGQMLAEAPPDSNEIALIMARQLVDVLGLPQVSLALYDSQADTHMLRYIVDYFEPADVPPGVENWTGKLIPMSDYPDTIRAMETLEPQVIQISDPDIVSAQFAYMKKAGTKTEAIFPMAVKGRFIGIIAFETWVEEHHYTSSEINLAMAMANQAAVALERTQLYETAQHEISERKQAEEALRESETKFRNVVDSSPMGVHMYHIESEERLVFDGANRTADSILGVDNSQFVGKTIEEAFPPLSATEVPDRYRRAALQGESWVTEQIDYKDEKIAGVFEVHAFQTEPGKMVAMFLDITDRKRAEEAQQKYTQQLETLNTVTAALTSSLALEQVLKLILEQIQSVVPLDSATIFLKEDGRLRIVMDWGISPSLAGKVFSEDDALIGDIATSKDLLILDNPRDDPRFKNWGSSKTIQTWMGVPLFVRDELIGYVTLDSNQPKAYMPEHISLVKPFAAQAAQTIDNARLFNAANRRLERLSSLRQIDQVIASSLDLRVTFNVLLGQTLQQLEVDAAAILLYRPELRNLEFVAGQGFRTRALQSTNLRLGEGYAGRVALEQRTVIISNREQLETRFLRSPEFTSEEFVSYVGVPLVTKGNIIGVLEIFHRQSLDPDPEWMEFLETLTGQAAIAIDNINLFSGLQMSNLELVQAYDATIEGWARALELRDMEIEGHSRRVVDLAQVLGQKMGIEENQLVHVRRGALLHDIGKMGVPDAILQKTGQLTDEEWENMRQHPTYAYQWLAPIKYLQPALDIPYCHHEKWDGTGYPRGLKGEQIPLPARIFAVVDVWDALFSDRPYRKAWPQEKIFAYLREQSGQYFDPQVVEVFIELLSEKKFLTH